MAITRIWQAGAETGGIEEFTGNSGGMYDFYPSTTQKYTGAYSFKDNENNDFGYKNIPATRQLRMGFAVYGNTSTNNSDCVSFRDSGANRLVALNWKNTGEVALKVGGVQKDIEAAMNVAVWHHVGLDVKIHASDGWAVVYLDGIQVMSFTGTTGNVDIEDIIVGNMDDPFNQTQYYDDLYADDATGEGSAAPLSLLRFYHVVPSGAGNYAEFDPSTGANYECVNEIPPNAADYVSTSTADEYDSYAMNTISIGAGQTVQAVIPIVYCKRGDTTEEIALGTRYSSTDAVGSDQVPGASYGALLERQTAKPGGGAWDQTAIDGFEVLIKSRGTY